MWYPTQLRQSTYCEQNWIRTWRHFIDHPPYRLPLYLLRSSGFLPCILLPHSTSVNLSHPHGLLEPNVSPVIPLPFLIHVPISSRRVFSSVDHTKVSRSRAHRLGTGQYATDFKPALSGFLTKTGGGTSLKVTGHNFKLCRVYKAGIH